ncbi:MAG: acylphosphatase [Candidatus Cloacimonetes bacterium]|jgi:acylphosphatase|nr:acylphosphatase [Candidatus Cloacimonadota bacterium]MBT5420587.1 acylphosphatase [Candidatus Cloacimonadota bacterium]
MKNLEIIVSGRVQGVCYRAFVLQSANELNINGYTKNLVNGDVKVIAIAEDSLLEVFVNMLKEGPSMARVENLVTSEIIIGEEFDDFSIKY